MSGSSTSQAPATSKEYVVRVPKTTRKKYHMMRFNQSLGGDFFKNWTHCRMERENNFREFKEEDTPKFGAGSEYGRELKEEARRKRLGIHKKRYKPDDQPWLLSLGTKPNKKKYKGIREGGVSDHTAWYVFMQGKDGSFEAYPVEEWYNFQPINRYKALSAEEAEKEFEKRDQIMNFFQVMIDKKFKKDDVDPDDEEGKKKGKGSKAKNMLLSEMDDWLDDDDGDDDEDGADSDDDAPKKKKKAGKRKVGKGGKKAKREEGASDDSCIEESDDYDEGAEHDYISGDSSDSDQENDEKVVKDLAGVEEGDALKKLLESDDSDEEKEKDSEKEEKEKEEEESPTKEKSKKSKKRKKDSKNTEDSDSVDSASDAPTPKKAGKNETTVSKLKRKVKENPHEMPNAKKMKLSGGAGGSGTNTAPPSSDSAVSEEAIRRYLARKPMTTTELLQKFKSKKTGLKSEQLVQCIANVLKRVNPVKKTVKGKMYMSLGS